MKMIRSRYKSKEILNFDGTFIQDQTALQLKSLKQQCNPVFLPHICK